MSFSSMDWIVLGAYLAMVAALGISLSRKSVSSSKEYFIKWRAAIIAHRFLRFGNDTICRNFSRRAGHRVSWELHLPGGNDRFDLGQRDRSVDPST